ncbi:hypothetical protein FACS189494_01200 [Spirochaetia bacterium]|nr:hypothetical protein FACS189494_01200 [Spirochaetia bacterium]
MRKSYFLCFVFSGIFLFTGPNVFAGGQKDKSEPVSNPAFSGIAGRNMEAALAEIENPNQGAAYSGPTYTGDGGKGKSIAIFRPNGVNISQNSYLLDTIQGAFISYFNIYSGIEVSDRLTVNEVQNQRAYEEKNLSDERIRARVGEEVGAQYTMGGRLTWRQDAGNYELFLVVTDNTKRTNVASTEPVVCTKDEIEDFSKLRPIALKLLQQMGVTLTNAGRNKLLGIDDDLTNALNAQARGIAAMQSGGEGRINIAAMNYLYQAQMYKQTASEADKYLEYLQRTQGANKDFGSNIQAETRAYQAWLKTIEDFSVFYTNHPPFDFYYTPPQEVSHDVTTGKYKLSFQAGLRWNADSIAIIKRILDEINSGLNNTGKREAWKLSDWPSKSTLFRGPNNFKYNITADVINGKGERFTRLKFILNAGLILNGNNIGANAEQEITVVSGDLTIDMNRDMSGFAIRIIDINSIDAEEAGRNGIVKITMVKNMPEKQQAAAAVDRALATVYKDRAKDEVRSKYQSATIKDIRFGVKANYTMLMLGEKDLAENEWRTDKDGKVKKKEAVMDHGFLGGVEFGLKLWYLEANGMVSPNFYGFDFGSGIEKIFDVPVTNVGVALGGGLSFLSIKENNILSPYISIKLETGLPKVKKNGLLLRVTFIGRFLINNENPKQEYLDYIKTLNGIFLPSLNIGTVFFWK